MNCCPTCGTDMKRWRADCKDPWHPPKENKTVQKWADQAMFTAEPIAADEGPKVYLLWMTPDPLAAIAAACKMYKGEVARSLRDVTHAERREFLAQVMKTKLQAPFEFVKFHFMVEGVTRAFTHQMVRQRTAVYAQESLRFAVKEDMPVALPPSLAGTKGTWAEDEQRIRTEAIRVFGEALEMSTESGEWVGHNEAARSYLSQVARLDPREKQRAEWDRAVRDVGSQYKRMVEAGMPAEDARGLLPHNTLTRLHYSTDLRALLDHAGNRLCTQAQFEWRLVFTRIVEAIRNYDPYVGLRRQLANLGEVSSAEDVAFVAESDRWQYEALADMFRPVCYLTGKCEFKADFDRACSIRDRVEANHVAGRPSSEWATSDTVVGADGSLKVIDPIRPAEWLLDAGAAR